MPGLYLQEEVLDGHLCLEHSNDFLILESIFPNTSDVRLDVTYGDIGDPGVGTLSLPVECDVVLGVQYGAPVCGDCDA